MPSVLSINSGSSTIKFARCEVEGPLKRGLHGTVDRIDLNGTNLTFQDPDGKPPADRRSAADFLVAGKHPAPQWLAMDARWKRHEGD